MNLSKYIGTIPDYLEYAWVCAPNATAQALTANTLTTLTINSEVADYGGHGSIGSNQVTLAAGTYAFQVLVPHTLWNDSLVAGLYNITESKWVSRCSARGGVANDAGYRQTHQMIVVEGQFTIAASSVFEIQAFTNSLHTSIGNATSAFTLATAGLDQRTTLQLWKLQ
jgi:hypothetical protein